MASNSVAGDVSRRKMGPTPLEVNAPFYKILKIYDKKASQAAIASWLGLDANHMLCQSSLLPAKAGNTASSTAKPASASRWAKAGSA